jgi:hypothetical protein
MSSSREVRCTNPACAMLNRVPSHSVSRIPICGQCGSELPVATANKSSTNIYRLRNKMLGLFFHIP